MPGRCRGVGLLHLPILVDRAELPSDVVAAVERYKFWGSSGKANLALSGLPEFTRLARRPPRRVLKIRPFRGAFSISPSVDYLVASVRRRKTWRVLAPSVHLNRDPVDDRSRNGAAGKHVMSVFVQYAPYDLNGGWTLAEARGVRRRRRQHDCALCAKHQIADHRATGAHARRHPADHGDSPRETFFAVSSRCISSFCGRPRSGQLPHAHSRILAMRRGHASGGGITAASGPARGFFFSGRRRMTTSYDAIVIGAGATAPCCRAGQSRFACFRTRRADGRTRRAPSSLRQDVRAVPADAGRPCHRQSRAGSGSLSPLTAPAGSVSVARCPAIPLVPRGMSFASLNARRLTWPASTSGRIPRRAVSAAPPGHRQRRRSATSCRCLGSVESFARWVAPT